MSINYFFQMRTSFLSNRFQIQWELMSAEWGVYERMMENCLNVLCTITTVAFMKPDVSLTKEFIADLSKCEVVI